MCLIVCWIYANGENQVDMCKWRINVEYETKEYYYGRVEGALTEVHGGVKAVVKPGVKRIEKVMCDKEK